MATDWNRPTFRVGAGNYDELNAVAEEEGAAEKEKGDTERGDGRGAAVFDGAPKPQPGDELYETLYQARTEATERATAARNDPSQTTAAEFAALIAMSAPQPEQGQRQEQEGQQEAPRTQEAAGEITQPRAEQEGRQSFQSLRMEHAAGVIEQGEQREQHTEEGPTRPGSRAPETGLMADFVTEDTRAAVLAEREQYQSQQRTRTMGLAL